MYTWNQKDPAVANSDAEIMIMPQVLVVIYIVLLFEFKLWIRIGTI